MFVVTYAGRVEARQNSEMPFLVVVTSSGGKVVAKYPVRKKAEGDAKLAETIESLKAGLSKLPRKH